MTRIEVIRSIATLTEIMIYSLQIYYISHLKELMNCIPFLLLLHIPDSAQTSIQEVSVAVELFPVFVHSSLEGSSHTTQKAITL